MPDRTACLRIRFRAFLEAISRDLLDHGLTPFGSCSPPGETIATARTVCFNRMSKPVPLMKSEILSAGEKVHIIHRRYLEKEPHRHFVGIVEVCQQGVARVTGHLFTVDPIRFEFFRRPERRTRIVSLVSGDVLINIVPQTVDLDKIFYQQESKALRVTDGSDWHLDLSELAWM
jgi:hypothetical protein